MRSGIYGMFNNIEYEVSEDMKGGTFIFTRDESLTDNTFKDI